MNLLNYLKSLTKGEIMKLSKNTKTPFVCLLNGKLTLVYNLTFYDKPSINFYDGSSLRQQYITDKDVIKKINDKTNTAKALYKAYGIYQLKNLTSSLYYAGRIGTDPEVFLGTKKGELIPAFDVLPGKDKPLMSDIAANCGTHNKIYWDGYQAEFDVAANTCLSFVVDSVHNGLKKMLKASRDKYPGSNFLPVTTADIPAQRLQEDKEEHVQFGCMPSFNIYNMKGIRDDGRNVPFRSAGGHIHFGNKINDYTKIIKSLDAILGVACVSMFGKYDDGRRRLMYGLAGEYRTPPHGLEYRTLSNAWMFHPLTMHIIFDLARKVFAFGQKDLGQYWDATEEETIKCINENNIDLAQTILKRNEKLFKLILKSSTRNGSDALVDKLYDNFINGVDSMIADFKNIESNWLLDSTWIVHSEGKEKNLGRAIDTIIAGKKVS